MVEAEVRALRTTAAVSVHDHVTMLRIRGAGALDVLDHVVSSRLFVRENQMLHTLALGEDARILADVFVCQDEDSVVVLAETRPGFEFAAHLADVHRTRVPEAEFAVEDLRPAHVLWGVDGPYAWELVSALLGPDVLGAPYLSFLNVGGATCFRAGKCGEYGYLLMVPRAEEARLSAKLEELSAKHGAGRASLGTLDRCALENWHFSMRILDSASPALSLTPLELQLQWRVHYDKPFVGSEALLARRSEGARGRVTAFTAGSEVRPRDRLRLGERDVGEVLAAGFSHSRGEWVGWALLDTALAHPGIKAFSIGDLPIETRSPPLLNNRSLHVDPHRHSHQTRDADAFPPLVLA